MRVRYVPAASAELTDILSFVGERSRAGAQGLLRNIRAAEQLLADHPLIGQLTDAPGQPLRRLALFPSPYFLFYEIWRGEIVIIAIRHTSRDPKTMPGRAK